MSVLRFIMLLALIVWIGAILFFGAVVAPTVFMVLPSHELAGQVVIRSLDALHWMGIVSGVIFIVASILYSRFSCGYTHVLASRNVLMAIMVVLTAISLFGVTSKMEALHRDMGVIDNVPLTDSRRIEFDRLHQWSTGIEGSVFIIGLGVVFLTGKAFSS